MENEEQPSPQPLVEPVIQIKALDDAGPDLRDAAEDAFVKKHMERFSAWQTWRQPYESLWTEIYSLYMTASRPSKIASRAKIVLPIVFQIIEAALPKITSIIFGQTEFFQAIADNPDEEDPKTLEKIQTLIHKQLDQANFFSKFVEFAKQLILYGTSYFYVYHKVRREWVYERVPDRQPVSFMGFVLPWQHINWTKKLEYKIVERRPEVEVLDIADVYPDPDARNEEESRGVYVVSMISRAELEEMSKGSFPVYGNFERFTRVGAEDAKQPRIKLDRRSIRGTGEATRADKTDGQVELITFWGKDDIDGDGIREEVQIVFADKKVVIKGRRNPFEHQERPVVRSVLFPVPLEWYGLGLVEPVIPLVNELTTIRRQNIDQNNLIINRMWKVDGGAHVDLDNLVASPNVIIVATPASDVTPIDQPPIPVSPIQMSEMIQRDIENATAPQSIQGTPESGALGRTARGAQLIISQALEKYGLGSRLVEDSGVKRVLKLVHKLNWQFLDQDPLIQEFYPSIQLSPEEIRTEAHFRLLGLSETVTKESMLNQIVGFISVFKDVPGINLLEVAKTYWDMMQLNKPSSQVIQQMPPEVVAAMMQQGQAPAQPGAPNAQAQAVMNQAKQNGVGGSVSVPSV